MIQGLGYLDAPPEVLQGLRDIDPDADLVHLGGKEWLLGIRGPNPAARGKLHARLADAHAKVHAGSPGAWAGEREWLNAELSKELSVLQLCADGFRPIHLYTTDGGSPDHSIVHDFRMRDYNYRTRPEEAMAEMREAISFDEQDRIKRGGIMRDFARSEANSLFRHVFKRARSFLQRHAFPGSN